MNRCFGGPFHGVWPYTEILCHCSHKTQSSNFVPWQRVLRISSEIPFWIFGAGFPGYTIRVSLPLLCYLIPAVSSMAVSFRLSMVSQWRFVPRKHKSGHEQKRLARLCLPAVDYTFPGAEPASQVKAQEEPAVISVITCLAWSEESVSGLAGPSWLRLSALRAVSSGVMRRLRPSPRDESPRGRQMSCPL